MTLPRRKNELLYARANALETPGRELGQYFPGERPISTSSGVKELIYEQVEKGKTGGAGELAQKIEITIAFGRFAYILSRKVAVGQTSRAHQARGACYIR